MYDAEEQALIWLCACTDLDDRARVLLLRAAKSPKKLFDAFETYLSSVIKEGKYRAGTRTERERARDEFLDTLSERGYFAVTLLSDDYPAALRAIPDPPLVLFGMGNRSLLGGRKFCIVGSRLTPSYAERQGERIAAQLSARFVIVTGLAEGGDSAAVRGALPSGNIICVLPHGLDGCYPATQASLKRAVAQNGLLLSEYPSAEPVRKHHFYARNRILAGLSEGMLMISAGQRSGVSITANFALEYGRDVFAFPYQIGAAQGVGCNEYIKKGAFLCTEAEDILSHYGIQLPKAQPVDLSAEEAAALAALREEGQMHLAELAQRLGRQIHEIAPLMAALEIKGLAVKSGGNRYSAL